MLTRFFETAAQYAQTFRNLAVEETRVIEEFDESGRIRKRREIVADVVEIEYREAVPRAQQPGIDGMYKGRGLRRSSSEDGCG